MKKELKKTFLISLSLVGAMIGVGLASGKEVVSFFMKNGKLGFLLCFLSSIVIFALIYVCLLMNLKNNHKKEKCKIAEICVKNDNRVRFCHKQNVADFVFELMIFFCQIVICSAMFAGMFSLFSLISSVLIVRILMLFFVYIFAVVLLCMKSQFVFSLNFILTVLLCLFSFFLILFLFVNNGFNVLEDCDFSPFSFLNVFLYAGMNVLTIYPILKEKSNFLKNKKQCFFVSFFVWIFIFVILELLSFCVYFYGGGNISSDLIMLSISLTCSKYFFIFHFWLIMFSVFTTLISTSYGASLSFRFFDFKTRSIFILTFCFLTSFVGFSNMINFVYPFVGFIFIVYVLIFVCLKRKNIV